MKVCLRFGELPVGYKEVAMTEIHLRLQPLSKDRRLLVGKGGQAQEERSRAHVAMQDNGETPGVEVSVMVHAGRGAPRVETNTQKDGDTGRREELNFSAGPQRTCDNVMYLEASNVHDRNRPIDTGLKQDTRIRRTGRQCQSLCHWLRDVVKTYPAVPLKIQDEHELAVLDIAERRRRYAEGVDALREDSNGISEQKLCWNL